MKHPARLALLGLLASCAAAPAPAPGSSRAPYPPSVASWGTMREVLREGHTQGRVALAEVVGPHTLAVGAVAGLAAEITISGGRAQLAEVVEAEAGRSLRVRPPAREEQATLLVLADVARWSEHALPAVADLAALEALVRDAAAASGLDVARPFPFRVEGRASHLSLHVLAGSCPIAHPDGPAPLRFAGADETATLVGFYAQDAAGRLTHHGQATHTHAILTQQGVSGHLDEVAFEPGAALFLPAR